MKDDRCAKSTWQKFRGLLEREMSITLLFWLIVLFAAVIIKAAGWDKNKTHLITHKHENNTDTR
jgi:hypothetical protein